MNQPLIIEEQNAPDTGYGGGGIHHDLPRDLAYGSSGIAQNPPQNTQVIQDNNMNNLNSNNLNQNAGNEFQNQVQVNNNANNNAPWLENTEVNRNDINPAINNDSNNLNLNNNININSPNPNPNPQFSNDQNNNYQNSMFPNNNMNQMPNTNLNQNTFNNQPVVPITQDQRPAEERKEEEKKEEAKKEDDEYNDFFEGEPPKANPPKKPDSLNEENNTIEIKENEKKINYICKLKLHGHSDDVNCIFETFDKKLISYGKDGFILIWTLDLPEKPIK